jgi:hypothetical protein
MTAVRCLSCDAENDPEGSNWRFCTRCGKSLPRHPGSGTAPFGQFGEPPATLGPEAKGSGLNRAQLIGSFVGIGVLAVLLTGPLRDAGYLLSFAAGVGIILVAGVIGRAVGSLLSTSPD